MTSIKITASATTAAPPEPTGTMVYVLAGRPLHRGADLEQTAVFNDDVWPLGPALLRADARPLTLDFTALPTAFRPAAKRLHQVLLAAADLPLGETPLSIASIRTVFTDLKRLFTWLERRQHYTLAEVTRQDLEDYHADLITARMSGNTSAFHRRCVRMLWVYRDVLDGEHLHHDPYLLPSWQAWERARRSHRRGENSTERIPEEVMGPLLTWALRWVDDFATDVLAAGAERAAVDSRPPAGPHVPTVLAALLDTYRARRAPLPTAPASLGLGSAGRRVPNASYLARLLGYRRGRLSGRVEKELIEQVAAELGLADDSYLDHIPQAVLDGTPWLTRISYYEVPRLQQLLQVACWITVAYLSGMRDSEIKHLRRGCVAVQRDPTGRVYRHRLHSLAFKGEVPAGVPAAWVVTAPVARAVAVLEQLQPPGRDFLFSPLASAVRHQIAERADRVAGCDTTNKHLAAFVSWTNDYAAARARHDVVPDVGGHPFRLTTRQFRRTLAWFIARRPGGVIAGALQYRHQSIHLFEGYAGTSDSGFRAEVQAEDALARGQYLGDLGADSDRPRLVGPAGAEAEQRLANFARHTVFDGQVVIDEARLRRIIARHDPGIYPGAFVTCVYNADRALCRTNSTIPAGPELGDCRPLACRNTALTSDNLAAHTQHIAELDRVLALPEHLAPYVRHRLNQQREDSVDFLARHAPEPI
ncbi:hypothetical protein AB0J03_32750 [Streptomyces microflavus]|uniref:hypothetical protein n=1 Tax=Streptomyces microflavus TaxID=1919 RepID=UPI0033C4DCE8